MHTAHSYLAAAGLRLTFEAQAPSGYSAMPEETPPGRQDAASRGMAVSFRRRAAQLPGILQPGGDAIDAGQQGGEQLLVLPV